MRASRRRPSLRLPRAKLRAFQIVSSGLQVSSELFFHLLLDARPLEQIHHERAE